MKCDNYYDSMQQLLCLHLTLHESAKPYYCHFMADGLDSQVDVSSQSDQPDLVLSCVPPHLEHEESSRTHDQYKILMITPSKYTQSLF